MEAFLRSNYNRADQGVILDYYHGPSYLEQLGRAFHPEDKKASAAWSGRW